MSAFVSHTSSLLTLIASHLHSYNIPSLLSAASPSPLSYSTSLFTPHSLLSLSLLTLPSHSLPHSLLTPTLLHHSSFSLLLTPHSSLSPLSYTTSLLPHTLPSLPLSTFTHTTVQSTCHKTIHTSYVHAISHTHTHSNLRTNTVIPIPIHPHTHTHTHTHSPTHSHPQSLYTTQHPTCSGGGGERHAFQLSHTADIHYNQSPIHTHLANHNSHWRRNHPLLQRMPTQ